MVVRPSGRLIWVRFVQSANACCLMICVFSGIVTSVSPVAPANAYAPISVRLDGNVTPVNVVKFAKLWGAITFTPSGISISVSFGQPENTFPYS